MKQIKKTKKIIKKEGVIKNIQKKKRNNKKDVFR